MKDSQAFNLLNQFLAINTYDEKKKYDLILVLGNAIAETGLIAYQLYKTGHAYHFMIAGGKGHTTDILINTIKEKYDIKDITKRSEAELFKYLIEENYGVDNTILLEKESTNCGENIQFAFKLLKKEDIIVKNIPDIPKFIVKYLNADIDEQLQLSNKVKCYKDIAKIL